MSDMVDNAIDLAERGYHVFSCKPRKKTPLTTHGFKDATVDELKIRHAWDRRPDANIGVSCGASRIAVLDIDPKAGADPREIIDQLDLEQHPIVWTGEAPERDTEYPGSLSGVRGAHIYFQDAEPTRATTIKGVEIRSVGAYVIAPPSIHASGVPYTGSLPPVSQLAELPETVRAILPALNTAKTAKPAVEWISIVRDGVDSGQRNTQLTRLVGHLLRRYVDVDLAAAITHLVNTHRCKPPLPADEIDVIMESVAGRELRRRQKASR